MAEPERKKHRCTRDFDKSQIKGYGVAIDECYEEGGKLWVSNGEYANTVSYCPFCGFEIELINQDNRESKKQDKNV